VTAAALVSPVPVFDPSWGAWGVVAAAAGLYAWGVRRPGRGATRRQAVSFAGALGVAVVACTWPLADLAAHRLLLALVVQRLMLLLALPPLLLGGLPGSVVAAITRPAPIDAVARVLSRPPVAVVTVTVLAVGTLTVPVVEAQSTSALARGLLDLALVSGGVVLWLPVSHPVPGTGQLSALGRAGYLVVQSIVPSFLCIVWIFARHPLYPAYARATVWGLTPLVDQQVSGFVAKLATICVLWTVALLGVLGAERTSDPGDETATLTWADVARQLERVERRERRGRAGPGGGDFGVAGAPSVRVRSWGSVNPAGLPGPPPTDADGPPGARPIGADPTAPRGPAAGWALRPDVGRGRRHRHGSGPADPPGGT
jgi:cytochrome c oxidase assembly factor CtaG